MKKIFSYILPMFAALWFASCSDLSSLENRVDSLESRVEALEKGVNKINERVEAVQKLVEGGTVSNVVEKDGVYTITFADGKTITLNQGSVGVANPPVMTVDGEGYWMVDYGKGPEYVLSGNQKIKAIGTDGVTPIFGVDSESYWTVSYNGGQSYEQVKDVNGNPVKAVPDGGAVEDKWFNSVSATDGYLKVELKDGTVCRLPIDNGFRCVITGADELVYFAPGETKTFNLMMAKVASMMVTAPQGWTASVSSAVLSVTAPLPTKAISADSKTDVCILAFSSNNLSSISKLRVALGTMPPVSYPGLYGKYYAGEDVTVGDIVVNKTNYPTVNYITSSSEDKTLKTGVNFVGADAMAEFPAAGVKLPIIVVGNVEGTRAELKTTGQIKLLSTETIADNVVIFKGIKLSTAGISEGYLLSNTIDNAINNLEFYDCRLDVVEDKTLSYANPNRPVYKFVMKDCDVLANAITKDVNYILQIGNFAYTMNELTFTNNVFWSDGSNGTKGFTLFSGRQVTVTELTVLSNTFVNVYPQATYAYCQVVDMTGGDISKNLFYFANYETIVNSYTGIVKEEDKTKVDEAQYEKFLMNYAIYAVAKVPTKKMKVGQNTNKGQIYNKNKEEAAEMFDFTEGSTNFNIAAGIFKPKKPEFGAKR